MASSPSNTLPVKYELPAHLDRYLYSGRMRVRCERLRLTIAFDAAYEMVLQALGCREAAVVGDDHQFVYFEKF